MIGRKNYVATSENSLAVHKETQTEFTIRPVYASNTENEYLNKFLYMNVYNSDIYSVQKEKPTRCQSVDKWVDQIR